MQPTSVRDTQSVSRFRRHSLYIGNLGEDMDVHSNVDNVDWDLWLDRDQSRWSKTGVEQTYELDSRLPAVGSTTIAVDAPFGCTSTYSNQW